jgi:hypothetical protein
MANVFASDPHCKSVFRFENGALTADSVGSNVLITGAVDGDGGAPLADVSDYKEGACSVFPEHSYASNGRYYIIYDANLDDGFPLKSNDTTKKITAAMWIKVLDTSGYDRKYILTKADGGYDTVCFRLIFDSGSLKLHLGKNAGTSYQEFTPGTLDYDKWYHVAFSYDDATRAVHSEIYEPISDTLQSEDFTKTDALSIENAPLVLFSYPTNGSMPYSTYYYFDGKMDELVFFDRVLTPDEIAQIAAGAFGIPTYEYETNLQATVSLVSSRKFISTRGVCLAPATGCKPEAEMSKVIIPVSEITQESIPTAQMSKESGPISALICKIRR